jgi:hypothetical protein
MAEKNFLSWVGFKGEGSDQPAPSENALERIRQLESQLSDMRSRRDITSLTKEEFEILATETAMSIIKSAQAREAKANSAAQKIINESTREVKEKLESAEAKAKAILSAAENRGRKYLQAAEEDADELRANAGDWTELRDQNRTQLLGNEAGNCSHPLMGTNRRYLTP